MGFREHPDPKTTRTVPAPSFAIGRNSRIRCLADEFGRRSLKMLFGMHLRTIPPSPLAPGSIRTWRRVAVQDLYPEPSVGLLTAPMIGFVERDGRPRLDRSSQT